MDLGINPFSRDDSDRHELWEILVRRDIEAFVAQDWEAHAKDFLGAEFWAVDASMSASPHDWSARFANMDLYADAWQGGARRSAAVRWAEDVRLAHYRASSLDRIDISGDTALVHKTFDGTIHREDGQVDTLRWRTLYTCRHRSGRWWITGLIGHLPSPVADGSAGTVGIRRVPASHSHASSGPYSPVVAIRPGQLVVISGQVAVERDGRLAVAGFDAQVRRALANCRLQLEAVGCGLDDVFKVNVYLKDLAMWARLNEIYASVMPPPHPARTTVGVALLEPFEVEIEMWAVRP
jgi:enamine deaminase RidA (YjgF/YER057c/UK114 family)